MTGLFEVLLAALLPVCSSMGGGRLIWVSCVAIDHFGDLPHSPVFAPCSSRSTALTLARQTALELVVPASRESTLPWPGGAGLSVPQARLF